jgi:hypothetical protein
MAKPATIPRDEVLDLVRSFPDEVDLEELIHRLYLREKLAAAEQDVTAGRTLTQAEMRAQAAEWRSK